MKVGGEKIIRTENTSIDSTFLWVGGTFLNMMRDMAASEVKRAAMTIIMMPTGMLLFRPVNAEIHPLWVKKFTGLTQQFQLMFVFSR